MNCPEKSVLSAYLDGETDWFENSVVELHLDVCSACRISLRASARLKELVNAIESPSAPDSLVWEILEMQAEPMTPNGMGSLMKTTLIAAASSLALFILLKISWPRAEPERPVISLNALIAAHNRSVEASPFAPTEALLSSAFEVEVDQAGMVHDGPNPEVF